MTNSQLTTVPEYIHYSLVAYVHLLAQGSIKIKIPNFQVQLCKRSEHYLLQLLNVSVLNFEIIATNLL